MNAFVFFDVVGNFFGDSVVVSKNLAYYFLHDVGFRRTFILDLGVGQMRISCFWSNFKSGS